MGAPGPSTLAWVLGFSAFGSVASVALAAVFLVLPERLRALLVPCLVSYAVGTLLAAAFLGLLPHALKNAPAVHVMATVLGGIVVFFLLEKIVLWRHCHRGGGCEVHGQAGGALILIGDALHNFVDGVVIAAAFATSIPVGIVAGLATVAHEVPQEVGDFAILLSSGYSRGRALAFNLLSSLATFAGALLAYASLAWTQALVPFVLALSAASFIYIAVADLMPGLHARVEPAAGARQVALVLAGIATIVVLRHAH